METLIANYDENSLRYRTCSKCSETKEEIESNFRKDKRYNRFRTDCRKCETRRSKIQSDISRIEYDMIRKSHVCEKCGLGLYWCLEHHHLDPNKKLFTIYDGFMKSHYRAHSVTMQRELAKCIVLCANCHRTLHENERALLRGDVPFEFQKIEKTYIQV